MAMNVGRGSGDDFDAPPDINTTPLIDVMLVLLIMLIVTIPLKTDAVTLQLSRGQSQPLTPPPAIAIDIDFDGSVSWNGRALTSKDDLEARLKSDVVALPDQPVLKIRPNRLASYKYVASVMAIAQRAGASKIGIIESAPAGAP
jgi:biopolymer transport protein ExbD